MTGFLFFPSFVFAAEPTDIVEAPFDINTITDNQIVQVLPEGGFIANSDGSSEFDPAIVQNNRAILMTYAEYKTLD